MGTSHMPVLSRVNRNARYGYGGIPRRAKAAGNWPDLTVNGRAGTRLFYVMSDSAARRGLASYVRFQMPAYHW